ncbi:hypothetical protein DL769_010634 [Monosporascus sp. CRB-8-3]|nr:hypothetical protein DL769_010634 [Monosporascus sp. CRB-8-3]
MSTTAINQIYSFPSEFIENLHVLPNGNLLLSTMESKGLLYTLDPTEAQPQAEPVASFDSNATGLTGIVPLEGDLYAVSGGLHTSYAFKRGSMHLYIVSLQTGRVVDSIPVPDTATMNGLAALPHNPYILLSADSIDGRIFSIDTRTRKVSVMLEDPALGPGNGNSSSGLPPIGINGLRTRGDYIYFTNSNQGTFSRIRVGENGTRTDDFEILARSPTASHIYDDFTFDSDGNAYIAVHSSSVLKITPDGVQTTVAGGEGDALFKEPTSAALANDGKSIYVVTGGRFSANPPEGGQVIQIRL